MLMLSATGPEGSFYTWVLVGLPVYSPKVQVLVIGHPEGLDVVHDFTTAIPELPYIARFPSRASRLCRGAEQPLESLVHETSDELCSRLCLACTGPWQLTPLEHHVREDVPTLRDSVVTGVGATQILRREAGPARADNADDAFLLWRRMQRRQAASSARPPASGSSSAWPSGSGVPAPSAVMDAVEALGDESGESLLDAGALLGDGFGDEEPDILREWLEHVLDEDAVDKAEQAGEHGDEQALGEVDVERAGGDDSCRRGRCYKCRGCLHRRSRRRCRQSCLCTRPWPFYILFYFLFWATTTGASA